MYVCVNLHYVYFSKLIQVDMDVCLGIPSCLHNFILFYFVRKNFLKKTETQTNKLIKNKRRYNTVGAKGLHV